MAIAYIMQCYNVTSEEWMKRQISFLSDKVDFFAAIDNQEKSFNGTHVANLYSDYPACYKALMKMGFMKEKTVKERFNYVLNKNLKRYRPNTILVNYLSLAYKLKETLLDFEGDIFIQVHGYDVTWDFVSVKNGKQLYDENYFSFARLISEKAIYIANSNCTKSNLLNIGVPESKIKVKYFGVPCEYAEVKNYYKKEGIKILYLGRLVDCKAPDLVIKAFDYACEKGMDAELIIAGGGYLLDTCKLLRGRSKFKEKIKILGTVSPEKGAELREECDIFTAHNCTGAITNQIEAFGVSIIEAMSAGMPVVTGKSGGVTESIVDGETGFLFAPGDVEAHGELLYKLAVNSDLREELGTNAIKRVKKYFTLEKEKNDLMKILYDADL